MDEEAARQLDAQSGTQKSGVAVQRNGGGQAIFGGITGRDGQLTRDDVGYGDTGGASRFMYVAKASREERNRGLEGMPAVRKAAMSEQCLACGKQRMDGRRVGPCCDAPEYGHKLTAAGPQQNHHPTVKPLALMRWLCRLITPPGGLILDPFLGSGTTMLAAAHEGFRCVGIEREPDYCLIAKGRNSVPVQGGML